MATDWEEAVARWSSVGELGMEIALRKIGCSEECLSAALHLNQLQRFEMTHDLIQGAVGDFTIRASDRADAGEEGHIASGDSKPQRFSVLERSTILATIGRGSSSGREVILGHVTGKEFTAFCVNLASNAKIKAVGLHRSGEQKSDYVMGWTPEYWTVLANALVTNPAIIELDLRETGLGSEGVSCLMRGLELCKPLERLDLSGNPLGDKGVKLLSKAFKAKSALRILCLSKVGVGSKGVGCLVKSLQLCKTLEELRLDSNFLGDDGVTLIADFLASNTTLKVLDLWWVGCYLEGARKLSSALARNSNLERLSFSPLWGDALDRPMRINTIKSQKIVFSISSDFPGERVIEGYRLIMESLSLAEQWGIDVPRVSEPAPKNTTLRELRLQMSSYLQNEDPAYLDSLISMVRTNQTLDTLSLVAFKLPPKAWKERFFPALKNNATLKNLDLDRCEGLNEDVFLALMDVLQNSYTALQQVSLQGTGLADKSSQVDEELRINREYRSALRSQALVSTRSGRLVLCGYPFGGKTEISRTIMRLDIGAPRLPSLKMRSWKKVKRTFPAVERLLFGKNAFREISSRTRGCDILGVENQESLKSIWDFGGQKEYYALHDYLFPDMNNSCFLFVCSSRCAPDPTCPEGIIKSKLIMREECAYWMRFIASNSKARTGTDGQGLQVPCVIFVLTKKDTLAPKDLGISNADAKSVVRDLKSEFDGVVDLDESLVVIDGRSSEDVSGLLQVVKEVLGKTLENQTEHVVCERVREILGRWSVVNKSRPVLNTKEYYELCQTEMRIHDPQNFMIQGSESSRVDRDVRDVVLACLNDLGEIISLKGLGFIVTNPRWFGVGVLGSLINAFGDVEGSTGLLTCCHSSLWKSPHHEGGFVDRETMKVLLKHSLATMHLQQSLSTDQLTNLMIELEMCLKKDPKDPESSLFMPALFDDPTDSAAQGERQLNWKLKETGTFNYLGRRVSCRDKSTTFLTPGFFPRWQVHMLKMVQEKGWAPNPAFEIGRNLIGFSQNGMEVLIEYSGDIDYFVDILVRSSKSCEEVLEFIESHVLQNIRQFCASPQGCQGVVLVTSVIRPACVKNLDKCIDRKHQSVLISVLEGEVASDPGYKHTWRVPRGQDWDTSYALDLLKGTGSFRCKGKSEVVWQTDIASSSGSISSHGDELPKMIYPTIHDVDWLRNVATGLHLRKKVAIKLHLLCDNKDEPHVVEKQPGRTYTLKGKDGGVDLPIANLLVRLLHSAAGVGLTLAGAPLALPSIDGFLQSLDAPEMPGMDLQKLHAMLDPATARAPESKEDICELLRRYMEMDPHALGLKKFLDLDNWNEFRSDFQLHKVRYKEAPHHGRIGWVCDDCYGRDLMNGILESVS